MLVIKFVHLNRYISWRVVHRVCVGKTKWGCCIIGPIRTKLGGSGSVNCNGIAVKDEGSGHLAKYYFIHKDEIKDVGVEEMSQKMYNQGFNNERRVDQSCKGILNLRWRNIPEIDEWESSNEPRSLSASPSIQDRSCALSNNYCQVLKRVQHLKHKMGRNPKFAKLYTEFMDNLFAKWFAIKLIKIPKDVFIPETLT